MVALASVHTPSTCNQPDVDAAVTAAKNDTEPIPIVAIPMGICPQTTVSLPKAILLQGVGIAGTTIGPVSAGDTASRIMGLTVTASGHLIQVEGQGWRVDHVKCVNTSGVIANCVFATGQRTGKHPTGTIDHVEMVNSRTLVFGDGLDNWSEPSTVGNPNAQGVVTVEDSTITSTIYSNCFDLLLTARVVFRRNQTKGCWLEAHSNQGTRNARSWEIIDNIIDVTGTWVGIFL